MVDERCPGYPECDHETWGNAGDVFSHGAEDARAEIAPLLRRAYMAITCLVRTEHLGRSGPCLIGLPDCVECDAERTADDLLVSLNDTSTQGDGS